MASSPTSEAPTHAVHNVERSIGDKSLAIETGLLAKQASGAVTVRYGDTVILTAVVSANARPGLDFFPLTVDYREKTSAAGKFPGGFIKREGRPSTKEILTMRLTDRPIRPLFPEHYRDEVQIMTAVLSADRQNDPDILSIIGASAALMLSNIPFHGPIGAVRVGRIGGELVVLPTHDQLAESDLDLIVCSTRKAVVMIEGFAREFSEEDMTRAIGFAHEHNQAIIEMQTELRQAKGLPPIELPITAPDDPLEQFILEKIGGELKAAAATHAKLERREAVRRLQERVIAELASPAEAAAATALTTTEPAAAEGQREEAAPVVQQIVIVETAAGVESEAETAAGVDAEPESEAAAPPAAAPRQHGQYTPEQIHAAFHAVERRMIRELILEGVRPDGRGPKDIRPIRCQVGVLPRTHGSAIFQRGETQALVTTTLGTASDEQRVDGLVDEYTKKFMLDYNMPPFAVGEVRPLRGPGRREIGHGALAERSVKPVIPSPDEFAYTIRVVSDILESNGSSSMASVCGATLALMDAGVPISDPVAGISIGLVYQASGEEGEKYTLLSDIIGDEDHFGDMDFKVAGTQHGITGIQLDLKIEGISEAIVRDTLAQAREARIHILREMLNQTLKRPREEISRHAPRMLSIRINPDKIGLVIGPGGKTIRRLEEESGAKIHIEDDGTITISCEDVRGAESGRDKILAMTEEVQIGRIYEGRVSSIKDFGAFVEIMPGKDGLVHISELSDNYVQSVADICRVGDPMSVKVIAIDEQDRIKLSRKAVLREQGKSDVPPGGAPPQAAAPRRISPPPVAGAGAPPRDRVERGGGDRGRGPRR